VTVRLGNVYGPRQDPLGEAGVVAIFCGKMLDGGTPTIFGDGTQTRDYTYVGDVVSAQLAAAASEAGGEFNVGTGRETTVLDVVEVLRGLRPGTPFEPEMAPARTGEVQRSCLDVSRTRETLGWEATVSLGEGLSRTLETLN
jgi:UDP-glucose 4-epimerase